MENDNGIYSFDDFQKKLKEKIILKKGKNKTAYSHYVIGGIYNGERTKSSASFDDYVSIDENFPDNISKELTDRLRRKLLKLPSAWYSFNFEFYGEDHYSGFHWIGDMKDDKISICGIVETNSK